MGHAYRNYQKGNSLTPKNIAPYLKPCGCGVCGLTFARTISSRRRIWAEGCPTRAAIGAKGRAERRRLSKERLEAQKAATAERKRQAAIDAAIKRAHVAERKRFAKAAGPQRDKPGWSNASTGKFCQECLDMTHARPLSGCTTCGLPYQAEVIERPNALISNAGCTTGSYHGR